MWYDYKDMATDEKEKYIERIRNGYCWLESASANVGEKNVLLLHGVTGYKEDMLPLADRYEAIGYRVVALDLPGHGGSAWIDGVTFRTLAAWLRTFVVGMGGFDLIVSNSFASAVLYEYLKSESPDDQMQYIMNCPTPDTSRLTNALQRITSRVPLKPGWLLYTSWIGNGIRVATLARKRDRRSISWLRQSEQGKRHRVSPRASVVLSSMLYTDENPYEKNTISPSVQSRVTVVQGAKDNVATRRTPKILRELLPGADHILLPGVGHILHFEAPDEIVKLSLKV